MSDLNDFPSSQIHGRLAALYRRSNELRREIAELVSQLPEHEREVWLDRTEMPA